MNGGRRRMDPAEVVRGTELFGAKSGGEGYFRVGDFLGDGVVVRDPDYVDLRKVAGEAFGEPLGGGPEIEAVVGGDNNFNRVIGRSGHRMMLIIYQSLRERVVGGRGNAMGGRSVCPPRTRASGATSLSFFHSQVAAGHLMRFGNF